MVGAQWYIEHVNVHWEIADGVKRADEDHRFDYVQLHLIRRDLLAARPGAVIIARHYARLTPDDLQNMPVTEHEDDQYDNEKEREVDDAVRQLRLAAAPEHVRIADSDVHYYYYYYYYYYLIP